MEIEEVEGRGENVGGDMEGCVYQNCFNLKMRSGAIKRIHRGKASKRGGPSVVHALFSNWNCSETLKNDMWKHRLKIGRVVRGTAVWTRHNMEAGAQAPCVPGQVFFKNCLYGCRFELVFLSIFQQG